MFQESRYQKLRSFDEELIARYRGGYVLGADEVGVGPLAGPLVACALILKDFDGLEYVDDCKKLTPKARLKAYESIKPHLLKWQFYIVSVREIDRIGIYEAGKLAREEVCHLDISPYWAGVVIVDGNIPVMHMGNTPSMAIVKADAKSLTVAAASVLAKVRRDTIMSELAKEYPQYGWDRNRGYGVPEHVKAIKKYGITPYHRQSFAPIKEAMARR
jgi:ribonuclease HII